MFFHIFKQKTEPVQEPDWVGRIDTLEKRLETIEYEWTDWYDKFRRLHARLAKREQRGEDKPQETNGDAAGVDPSQLSLDDLNERIKRGLM